MEALQKEIDNLKINSTETRQVLVGTVQRLESSVNGHNALVKDIQNVFNQNGRVIAILDRTLQNKFGKGKWTEMVKASDLELANEMVVSVQAEEKRRQDEAATKVKEQPKK